MNNIEFQLLREDLHLTRQDLAEIWEVNPRTIQRWDRGDVDIPDNRKKQLESYYNAVLQGVKNFETVLDERIKKNGEPDEIFLIAYDAWSYDGDFPHFKIHNACLIKCKQAGVKKGYCVSIVPFKPQEYEEWLHQMNYNDSQEIRAAWASEYYSASNEVADIDSEYLEDSDF